MFNILNKSWRHIATIHPATGPWGLWGVWGQFSIQLLKATFQNQHLTFFYWEERSNAYYWVWLQYLKYRHCKSAIMQFSSCSSVGCFLFCFWVINWVLHPTLLGADQKWKRQQGVVCSEISGDVVLWYCGIVVLWYCLQF